MFPGTSPAVVACIVEYTQLTRSRHEANVGEAIRVMVVWSHPSGLLVPVCSGEHVPLKHQAVESANVSAAVGLVEYLIPGQAKLCFTVREKHACKPLTTNISLPMKY